MPWRTRGLATADLFLPPIAHEFDRAFFAGLLLMPHGEVRPGRRVIAATSDRQALPPNCSASPSYLCACCSACAHPVPGTSIAPQAGRPSPCRSSMHLISALNCGCASCIDLFNPLSRQSKTLLLSLTLLFFLFTVGKSGKKWGKFSGNFILQIREHNVSRWDTYQSRQQG
ncbi:hypothetical protein C8R31_104225 [Nitrosospira sp. Nsp2]|nr:hypothetical protein C8R31_104225 [Nitrosospira sp. Nsp2]